MSSMDISERYCPYHGEMHEVEIASSYTAFQKQGTTHK
jgi:hypothetical protein